MARIILFTFIIAFSLQACVSKKNSIYKSVNPSYFLHYNAVIQRNIGNYLLASSYIYNALKIDKTNPALYYELALLKLNEEKYDEAIFILEQAILLDNTNSIIYQKLLLNIYDITSNNEKAIAILNNLIEKGKTPYIVYQKAHFLIKSKKLREASALLKDEVQASNNPELKSFLIELYLQTNNLDSAILLLNQLEYEFPDNINPLIKLGVLHTMRGEDSLSLEKYQKALFINPNEPRALYGVIVNRIENNDSTAKSLLKEYVNNSYIEEEIKLYAIFDILSRESFTKTNRLFIEALLNDLSNKNISNLNFNKVLFQRSVQNNNLVEALIYNNRILLIDSLNIDFYLSKVQIEFSLEKHAEVITTASRAITFFPEKGSFYLFKAFSEEKIINKQQSINTLEAGLRYISGANEKSDILGTLADYYYSEGKKKKAFLLYEEAIKQNPLNYHSLNNYSYYLSIEKEQLQKALNMINIVVNDNPQNSTYLDTKGWILFKMGKYSEARDILRLAIINSGSSNPIILEHYGDALYKSGNKDSAYIYWLKAREAGGNSLILLKKVNTMNYVE